MFAICNVGDAGLLGGYGDRSSLSERLLGAFTEMNDLLLAVLTTVRASCLTRREKLLSARQELESREYSGVRSR